VLSYQREGSPPRRLAAALEATWQDGWFDQLREFYRESYPDMAIAQADEINRAIEELERIADQIIYPAQAPYSAPTIAPKMRCSIRNPIAVIGG